MLSVWHHFWSKGWDFYFFIPQSHHSTGSQWIILSWMNNNRPVVQGVKRLGAVKFFRVLAQRVMRVSEHLGFVTKGQNILQCMQFICLPFQAGACTDVLYFSLHGSVSIQRVLGFVLGYDTYPTLRRHLSCCLPSWFSCSRRTPCLPYHRHRSQLLSLFTRNKS